MIDVGYAGTIGADRITHGKTIYGEGEFPDDNPFGDTYGPANYYAYVPFELAMPWDGEWDELPSAHGAAIFFDLAAIAGLFFVGRRMRRAPEDADDDEARCGEVGRAPRSGSSSLSPGAPTRTRPTRCSRTRTTRWSRRC